MDLLTRAFGYIKKWLFRELAMVFLFVFSFKKKFTNLPTRKFIFLTCAFIATGISVYFVWQKFEEYQYYILSQNEALQKTQEEISALREESQNALSEAEKSREEAEESRIATETEKRVIETEREQVEQDYLKKSEELERKIEELVPEISPPSSATTAIDFANSVARIICQEYSDFYYETDTYSMGSGSIWISNNGYQVVTNKHVLEDQYSCVALIILDWNRAASDPTGALAENQILLYSLDMGYFYSTESGSDLAHTNLAQVRDSQPLSLLNRVALMPDLENCTDSFPIGTKVEILGYPGIGSDFVITLTEGIISSWEVVGDTTYYLSSAKIDQGNSGGLAFATTSKGISCVIGIPSYAKLGSIESLGRILLLTEAQLYSFIN